MKVDNYLLRHMREDDIPTYNKWSNDEEVVKYTYPVLQSFTLEDTRKFYEKVSNSKSSVTFMIEDDVTSESIGITSLINIDKVNGNAEFIIDIGERSYWGKGIGKLITKRMMAYAFEELKLHRLSLRVFSFNDRAIHIYKKLGFKEEGRSRQAIHRFDSRHDIVHMGILSSEVNLNEEEFRISTDLIIGDEYARRRDNHKV